MRVRAATLSALSCLLLAAVAFRCGAGQTSSGTSEMDRIFAEDQQVRKAYDPHAPKTDYRSDEQREAATRQLLASGRIQTAKEFEEAAFIFQHSHNPDDYLLAHTLAMIAVSKGDRRGLWIASASLDRYLMAIGKSQIYGTQFMTPKGAPVSQEPYNRELISDRLRKQLGVPSVAEQRVELKRLSKK